jgi:hypothetical protein
MYEFEYIPILIGGRKRYIIDLPLGASPRPFKTMTTDMRSWDGQVLDVCGGAARALIRDARELIEIKGTIVAPIIINGPCIVMEHLNIDGRMDFMIGDTNILDGNLNFVNFGIPGGKHIRIDIYNGDSRIIE